MWRRLRNFIPSERFFAVRTFYDAKLVYNAGPQEWIVTAIDVWPTAAGSRYARIK